MRTQEIQRLSEQLEDTGAALTSYEALNIPDYSELSTDVITAIKATEQYKDTEQEGRTGMLMFREDEPLTCGRLLVAPVAEILFGKSEEVINGLGMYAINHYEKGDFFNPHQDHFDGTVMIMTPMGRRRFDVYKKEPEDDVFVEVSQSFELEPGSIMLLNGYKNLGHAAVCLEGPSISVVADIPMAINTLTPNKE